MTLKKIYVYNEENELFKRLIDKYGCLYSMFILLVLFISVSLILSCTGVASSPWTAPCFYLSLNVIGSVRANQYLPAKLVVLLTGGVLQSNFIVVTETTLCVCACVCFNRYRDYVVIH